MYLHHMNFKVLFVSKHIIVYKFGSALNIIPPKNNKSKTKAKVKLSLCFN